MWKFYCFFFLELDEYDENGENENEEERDEEGTVEENVEAETEPGGGETIDQTKDGARCKNGSCLKKSHFVCSKWNVHLCINRERNCFLVFHCK